MSNFSDKAKAIIASIAPTVGTAIGGPFGALAGTVLANALGGKPGDLETAIVGGDPQVLLNLKKAELDFQAHMAELKITEEQLKYADVDSARKREIAVKDGTPAQLAWLLIGGFLVVSMAQIAAVIGYADEVAKVPSQGWLLIGNISGYLANEAKQAASYYFGSSSGSQAKDQMLYASTPTA